MITSFKIKTIIAFGRIVLYQKVLEYLWGETAWQRYQHLIPTLQKRLGKNITGLEGGAQQVGRAPDTATASVEPLG